MNANQQTPALADVIRAMAPVGGRELPLSAALKVARAGRKDTK